jgi:hypothetical protein
MNRREMLKLAVGTLAVALLPKRIIERRSDELFTAYITLQIVSATSGEYRRLVGILNVEQVERLTGWMFQGMNK